MLNSLRVGLEEWWGIDPGHQRPMCALLLWLRLRSGFLFDFRRLDIDGRLLFGRASEAVHRRKLSMSVHMAF